MAERQDLAGGTEVITDGAKLNRAGREIQNPDREQRQVKTEHAGGVHLTTSNLDSMLELHLDVMYHYGD